MIMILTDKCLKDFTEWNGNKQFDMMLPTEYQTYLNALIIEFFDSVGIYINIEFDKPYWYFYLIPENGIGNYKVDCNSATTRKQATEKAIETANEIYNEKKI